MGGHLRIRVVRDREETITDAASRLEPENWSPLQRVIHAVGTASPPPEGLLSPAEAAGLVERHFRALDKGLAADARVGTRRRRAELEQQAPGRMKPRVEDGH